MADARRPYTQHGEKPVESLTDIAQQISRHSPDALPPSLRIEDGRICFIAHGKPDNGATDLVANWYTPLPDDIAEAVLIAVMVLDARLERGSTGCHWLAYTDPDTYQMFSDPDYGGSIWSCHAAWKWAKGIT